MIKVPKEQMYKIAPLFAHVSDTVVYSCLQGHMGSAYTSNIDNPKDAIIHCGSFIFLEGTKIQQELIEYIRFVLEESGLDELIIISQVEHIGELLGQVYGDKISISERHAIQKKEDEFDINKLKNYVNKLPSGYHLLRIDERLYDECMKEDWSVDFVGNFDSRVDFLKRGIGFVVLHNNRIISGASSYTVYNEGIEIEIATKKEYRNRGIACVVGAALIHECCKQGRYPSWDAANMTSVKLATKFGYNYLGPYRTYIIHK